MKSTNKNKVSDPQGISGPMAELYDVFVAWEDRLSREMPGLEAQLSEVCAGRVLDVGCGSGRHVQALRERGFDAHGADTSADMLERAAALLDGKDGLHSWRLGEEPSSSLVEAGPFDAVISMGNVWPHLLERDVLERATAGVCELLRPGGMLLIGMKALAVRLASGDPYMPLLRRIDAGRPLWFVRFLDFAVLPLEDGTRVCDFHMVVVGGEAVAGGGGKGETLLHRTSRMRVWSAAELAAWFTGAGLERVTVSGRLDDPGAPPECEDVFVRGFVPGA